ncbi:hypothetical protein EDB87DRAFT_1581644 [Lactarius vividus]|nr:hypothetical protein EDB87DRAFT_1581644 [Lactarius vividus]
MSQRCPKFAYASSLRYIWVSELANKDRNGSGLSDSASQGTTSPSQGAGLAAKLEPPSTLDCDPIARKLPTPPNITVMVYAPSQKKEWLNTKETHYATKPLEVLQALEVDKIHEVKWLERKRLHIQIEGVAIFSIGLAFPFVVVLMGLVIGATSRRK